MLSYGNSEGEIEVSLSSFLSFSELEAGDYICVCNLFHGKVVDSCFIFHLGAEKKRVTLSLFSPILYAKGIDGSARLGKVTIHDRVVRCQKSDCEKPSIHELMEARKFIGLSAPKCLLYMVLFGNPGTGKTTVARLLGNIYYEMGILSKGHLVEVNRDELVDNMIGGSEKPTREAIERAKGGVLFVDEAYSLTPIGVDNKDYGRQVLELYYPNCLNRRTWWLSLPDMRRRWMSCCKVIRVWLRVFPSG